MEEYTQITIAEWQQWKEDIRQKLSETAGNFVYIGYRLKQIRDSGMYDGAQDIFGFAQNEYGLGKSTVSRFIAINEKYSEGGNSLELKEEYRNFSSSKLSEMLTLPDNECQLITEKTTVKEIRELKNFVREEVPEELLNQDEASMEQNCEKAHEDIPKPYENQEKTHEKTDDWPEKQYDAFEKCIIDLFKNERTELNRIMELLEQAAQFPESYKEAMELLNPSGQRSHKKGIIFLFMYDWNTGVKYKDLRLLVPVCMSWEQFLDRIYDIYSGYIGNNPDIYEAFYGKEVPEEAPKSESEKEPETKEEKDEETQQNQGFEDSVATSQQDEKMEKNDVENEENEEEDETEAEAPLEAHSEPDGNRVPDESGHPAYGETAGSGGTPASDDECKSPENVINTQADTDSEQAAAASAEQETVTFAANESESGIMAAAGEQTDTQTDLLKEADMLKEFISQRRWKSARDIAGDILERLNHLW